MSAASAVATATAIYVTNMAGDTVSCARGFDRRSDDAVSRGPIEGFRARALWQGALSHLDTLVIEPNIEHTRFPVPKDEQHRDTGDFPGLLRAADLIGQLADINYLRKTSALFNEFRETGMTEVLEIQQRRRSPRELSAVLLAAEWPYIEDALRYLSA